MIKHTFILYLLFILSQSVLGQTQIDKYISIKIPEKVQQFDTLSGNVSVSAHYSKNENDSYVILKESKVLKENEKNVLDKDLKSLKLKYAQIIASQIDAMSKNGFIFRDSAQIKINKFIGYKITYKDIASENMNAESKILYLNGSTYIITYSKVKSFSEANKNAFLNSLHIANPDEIKQIEDKSTTSNYLNIMFQYIFPLFILIGIVWYSRRKKRKTQM